jgi:[ribosomal protein S5]-alanine N-acetyltransferase
MAVIDDEAAAAPPALKAPAATGSEIWLNTPQWLLMTVTPAHAPLFARLHDRNGDHFRQGMTVEPQMTEPAFWEPLLAQQQACYRDGSGVFLAGFHRAAARPEIGCVINFAGIVRYEFEACWLGYRLDRSLQGQGLMHAALVPAIAAMFQRYQLHRMMATHEPDNLRSGRLLRRLGFGVEGYARDYMKVNGKWRDAVLVAMLAPQDGPQ